MAVGLNTGVPWVMCKEDDAPDPIVSFSCYSQYDYIISSDLGITFLKLLTDDSKHVS